MDVKKSFLNNDFVEVYMQPPPGFKLPPHKVCRLHRALYGLMELGLPNSVLWLPNKTLSPVLMT
jgi:hypothetical protein